MKSWEENARAVEEIYGGYVDWNERFYNCPECGEPIYECDWSVNQLIEVYCPVCGFAGEEEEEED